MSNQPNFTNFFYARVNQASNDYNTGNKDRADEICRTLVADSACPRAVKIQALQIRAICDSIAYLKNVLDICEKAKDELGPDDTIKGFSQHAQKMIEGFNARWAKKWKKLGREPPTEEEVEREKAERVAKEDGEASDVFGKAYESKCD